MNDAFKMSYLNTLLVEVLLSTVRFESGNETKFLFLNLLHQNVLFAQKAQNL